MRFYEFELIKPKHPDELVDKGASAVKSVAKSTASGAKGILGTIGKGIAKGTGMFFRDFDPAMQVLYKDGDPNQPQKKAAGNMDRKNLKTSLGKALNNEPLDDNDRKNLKIGLNQGWFKDMEDPEFKSGLQKILNKQTPHGQEIVMLKRVHAKIF